MIAVIGKTEGNGGVNDYTRIIADRAFREVLVAQGTRSADEVKQVPIVWSGGTDGVLSPHATVFATVPAIGGARHRRAPADRRLRDERAAAARGDRPPADDREGGGRRSRRRWPGPASRDPADVHYVQTKTPLLTIHTIRDAKSRGQTVWTEHTHESMDLSNGTTALGIGVALGEIDMPADADVMHDLDLYSSVSSCSSGVELDQAQIVVVGNARGVGGRYRIGHSVMKDALDADAHLGGDPRRRAGPARPAAPERPGRPAGQRVPQVRGLPRRRGAGPAQRHARRLRRALAPPDQGVRRRGGGRGDRRPGGVRLGVGRAPGPGRRRARWPRSWTWG